MSNPLFPSLHLHHQQFFFSCSAPTLLSFSLHLSLSFLSIFVSVQCVLLLSFSLSFFPVCLAVSENNKFSFSLSLFLSLLFFIHPQSTTLHSVFSFSFSFLIPCKLFSLSPFSSFFSPLSLFSLKSSKQHRNTTLFTRENFASTIFKIFCHKNCLLSFPPFPPPLPCPLLNIFLFLISKTKLRVRSIVNLYLPPPSLCLFH